MSHMTYEVKVYEKMSTEKVEKFGKIQTTVTQLRVVLQTKDIMSTNPLERQGFHHSITDQLLLLKI